MEVWQSPKYVSEILPFCVLHQGHCLTYTYSTFCWSLCKPFWSSPHFSQPEYERKSCIKFREVAQVTINPFLLFWFPWKHQKKLFLWSFQENQKGTLGKKGLRQINSTNSINPFKSKANFMETPVTYVLLIRWFIYLCYEYRL